MMDYYQYLGLILAITFTQWRAWFLGKRIQRLEDEVKYLWRSR